MLYVGSNTHTPARMSNQYGLVFIPLKSKQPLSLRARISELPLYMSCAAANPF